LLTIGTGGHSPSSGGERNIQKEADYIKWVTERMFFDRRGGEKKHPIFRTL